MDETVDDHTGGPDREPAGRLAQPDLGTVLLAAYFVALILIVVALLALPAIF